MVESPQSYFLVGIGGSGMLPLASILAGRGHRVAGSDRGLDGGRTPEKFAWLERQGIRLFPQDGRGITSPDQIVVASAAVEPDVPDMVAAAALGAPTLTRPQLLSQLFNAAHPAIGVAGTSGKSTVTGMIGWILHVLGRDPTVMNGAVMKNFANGDAPFASALVGRGEAFVSEVDESDGSIALYEPEVAAITNITLDHKPMDELRPLFGRFAGQARAAVLNLDDPEVAALAFGGNAITFSLNGDADIVARGVVEAPGEVTFQAVECGVPQPVTLRVPGRHNVQNALAALGAVRAIGIPLADAAEAIGGFRGLRRRLELVGQAGGVTVIDDFAHNPDKMAATLATLRAFPGRLLLFFQPHGYGPLKVMGAELARTFRKGMGPEDRLVVTDPVYQGGTVDRTHGSAKFVAAIGPKAEHIGGRVEASQRLLSLARPGDRIAVMGARDDTLSTFAADLLARLSQNVTPAEAGVSAKPGATG